MGYTKIVARVRGAGGWSVTGEPAAEEAEEAEEAEGAEEGAEGAEGAKDENAAEVKPLYAVCSAEGVNWLPEIRLYGPNRGLGKGLSLLGRQPTPPSPTPASIGACPQLLPPVASQAAVSETASASPSCLLPPPH